MEELQRQIDELRQQLESMQSDKTTTYRQNLRLTNALVGVKTYYVADSSCGAVTRKLTFKDGILTLET